MKAFITLVLIYKIKMLISELKTKNDKIILTQRVTIKCDSCNINYDLSLSNRNVSLLKYDKDLCRGCKQKFQYAQGIRDKQKKHIGSYSTNVQKGKTYEDLYGEEKSNLIKSSISSSISSDNPRWSLKYRTADEIEYQKKIQSLKFSLMKNGKTYEEQYGKERSLILKNNLSQSMTGDRNPMYGKPAPKKSGNGWSGWYMNHYFRSILELNYLHYLISNDIKFENGETKKFAIPYIFNEKTYNYYPDFYLTESMNYIEIKPKSLLYTQRNVAKFNAARELHKNNFIILTEDDIQFLESEKILQMHESGEILFDNKECINKGLIKIKQSKPKS